MSVPTHAQVRILDIPVSIEPRARVLAEVAECIEARKTGGYVSITNTESMYHALRMPSHLRFIQGARHSLCDGVGVIVAGWFWGLRIQRYNGPVFLLDCVEHGAPVGWRHFFFGGKEGVADEMARRLQQRFPRSECVGTYAPPFRPLTPDEDSSIVEMINAAKPDIVWVGLGLVKQEQWIAEHLGKIDAPWMVGVGAAFDYHSGAIPWAPLFLRAIGLEWLFRLIIQPRLRARRYWWSFMFVVEAALKGVWGMQFMRKPATISTEAG
jgi:N-acetylglucosaminyldiphosphoundecaprenol N-acetyl-beta-D-mannosaminyltransferase